MQFEIHALFESDPLALVVNQQLEVSWGLPHSDSVVPPQVVPLPMSGCLDSVAHIIFYFKKYLNVDFMPPARHSFKK